MSSFRSELNAPLLSGRYRPLELLARGGDSLVYRSLDENLGREVAIKLFSAGGAPDLERFNEELRLLASLSHHGVVSIVDAGIDLSTPSDPRPFLVMELLRGETVRDTIKRRELSAQEIGEIIYEVAEALDYVHTRGVIHRDITPSNVMLVTYESRSSRTRARLTDFGIAIESGTPVSEKAGVTGTAAYLSPEQVRNLPLSSSTDIYSLGLLMLECFTRRVAFPGAPVPSALARLTASPPIADRVPEPWATIIRRMTESDPANRPTAANVADEVRRALRE